MASTWIRRRETSPTGRNRGATRFLVYFRLGGRGYELIPKWGAS